MVVFPSWLPFFLQNPQKNSATQLNAKNARNAILLDLDFSVHQFGEQAIAGFCQL